MKPKLLLYTVLLTSLAFAQRPNIVFVIADDLDTLTAQTALSAGLMPNLQQYVISPGTTFNRMYVTDARGCPGRESYATGLYFHNMALPDGKYACGANQFNYPARFTLAVALKAAGYTTSLIGKVSDGYGSTDINHDGAITYDDLTYIPSGWDNWQALEYAQPWFGGFLPPPNVQCYAYDNPNEYEYYLNNNGTIEYYGNSPSDYQTDVLTSYLSNYLDVPHLKPFFLWLAPGSVHVEILSTENYNTYTDGWTWFVRPSPSHAGDPALPMPMVPNLGETDMSDKPVWMRPSAHPIMTAIDIVNAKTQFAGRIRALSSVDDMVGIIAQKCPDCLIIFSSDNGWFYGQHNLTGKLSAHEESINIPLYFSTGGGVSSPALLTANDIAPTIAELAGATVPPADGLSFVPLLTAPKTPWRSYFLVEHWEALGGAYEVPQYTAVHSPGSLYVQYATGEIEFYDLLTDPYELQSQDKSTDPRYKARMNNLIGKMGLLKNCKNGSCQIVEFAP